MKRFLLIQFRTDISVFHERDCFFRFFQRDLRLKIVNAFNKKINFSSPQKIIKKNKGIILGGSGEFYFSGNKGKKEKIFKEMLKRTAPLIKFLLQKDFPTLGICFGHQMLGYFLGVNSINDKKQSQTGSFLVRLTKEGKKDPLFSKIPQKFFAHFAHRDSLKVLPKKAKLLAKTKKCQIVAFRYKKKIFGVQFHPELNKKDMIFRLRLYPAYALKDLKSIEKKLKPCPFSSKVIENFIKICSN